MSTALFSSVLLCYVISYAARECSYAGLCNHEQQFVQSYRFGGVATSVDGHDDFVLTM